jgi:hypothetical protein
MWVGLVLVLGLTLVERLTFYGVKAVFGLYATAPLTGGGLGVSLGEARDAQSLLVGIAALVTLVGGGAAIAVGARRLLVLSVTLSAVAFAALAFAGPASLTLIVLVWAVAKGLFFANLYTVAAEQFAGARPMTLVACFASLTLAMNLGATGGPLFAALFYRATFAAGLFSNAAIMALAAGATTIVFVLDRAPTPPLPAAPRPALALLVVAAAAAPLTLIAELQAAVSEATSTERVLLQLAVLAGTNLLVIVAFIALAVVGSRISLLLAFGTALLVSALGAATYLGAEPSAASAALAGLGAAIAEPLVLALIAIVTPRRYTAAAFALLITLRDAVTVVGSTASGVPTSGVVGLGMVACAAVGVALVGRGRAIEAALFPALAAPVEARTARGSEQIQ